MLVFVKSQGSSLDHKCGNIFNVWDFEDESVEQKQCLSNFVEIARGNKI